MDFETTNRIAKRGCSMVEVVPCDLMATALKAVKDCCMDIAVVSAIFDFEREIISFECHTCNEIIDCMTVDFAGNLTRV